MDRRLGLVLPLVAGLAVAGYGLTARGEPARDAAADREGVGLAVSIDDYRGVLQERAGYAALLDHYVAGRRGVGQERAGYAVTLDHFVERHRAARQEARGHGVTTDILYARLQAAHQELLGHRVMLAHLGRTAGGR